jgi:hypothetical protein
LPCRNVREIRNPKLVRPIRLELTVDPIQRARADTSGMVVRINLPRLTPRNSCCFIRRKRAINHVACARRPAVRQAVGVVRRHGSSAS